MSRLSFDDLFHVDQCRFILADLTVGDTFGKEDFRVITVEALRFFEMFQGLTFKPHMHLTERQMAQILRIPGLIGL